MGTPFFESIFFRLLIAFLGVAVLPLALLGGVEYMIAGNRDEAVAGERLTQQVEFLQQDFRAEIAKPTTSSLRTLSAAGAVDEFLLASDTLKVLVVSDLERDFQRVAREVPSFRSISLVNRNGHEEVRVAGGRRIREYRDLAKLDDGTPVEGVMRDLYEELIAAGPGAIRVSSPLVDANGVPVFLAGLGRLDPNTGGFGCAIIIEYDLREFIDRASGIEFHGAPSIWMYDADGNSFLEPPARSSRLDPRTLANHEALTVTRQGAALQAELKIADAELLRVAAAVPNSVFRRDARTQAVGLLQSLVVGVLLAFGLAVLFSRLMSRPLVRLSDATHEVARGDLKQAVEIEGTGELRVLSESFNTMVRNLNQQQQDLVRASQFKSQFLANMSHELRTPLNAIIGFTRIVLRKSGDKLEQRQRRNLELVLESADHLLEMVNDLLDIERIEAGVVRIAPVTVSCREVLDGTRSRHGLNAQKAGLELHTKLASDDDLLVHTDPARLRQILDNLITNAIKYTEKGQIEVSAVRSSDGRNVIFRVRDQGKGIPPDQIEQIFLPFQQLEGGRGGVGLGLHLVRRLTELLDGEISVESEEGVGSTFTLTLPVGVKVVTQLSAPKRAVKPLGAGPSVLVIDDDPEAIQILQTELIDAGFSVYAATSGAEGLRLAHEVRPSAIVLDIVMPGMDGWTVLRTLHEDDELSSIPVVVASLLDDAPRAHELGIVAWLTKPVRAEDFRRVFDRIGIRPKDDVLIIEDDEETVQLMQQQFEELDVTVRVATDGRKALEEVAQRLPRLVVLDLLLPEMDGFEVLQHLRRLPGGPDVPIIVYTGKDLDETERSRLNHGFVEIIQKAGNGVESVAGAVKRVLAGASP